MLGNLCSIKEGKVFIDSVFSRLYQELSSFKHVNPPELPRGPHFQSQGNVFPQTAQHQVMWKETGKNPVTQSIYQNRPWSPQICFCLNYSNTCRLILNYPDYWGRVASPCFRRVLVDKFNEMDDLVLSPTVLWHCFLQRSTQPFHSPFISINRLVFTEGPRSGSREV